MTSINSSLEGNDLAARARLAGLTVNDVLRAAPAAGTVFTCFGIDTCCGGGLPLEAAAESAGIAFDDLATALLPTLPPTA
jgi:iron-sulfur cluster repair protein YtfE (RIC family)